ncbi:hypothetical protein ACWGCW_40775 [Streptomyces sp. NPDC054933]
MASAANIAAFNHGNVAGSWLGGVAIAAGLGYAAPNWTGAILAVIGLIGLIGAVVAGRLDRRQPVDAVPTPAGLKRSAAEHRRLVRTQGRYSCPSWFQQTYPHVRHQPFPSRYWITWITTPS